MVLERLNTRVRATGWFFPVEPSTASRCTIGGMTGNNSCGARSIRYGKMVDNVLAVEALLANGEELRFSRASNVDRGVAGSPNAQALALQMLALAGRERDEIERMFPKVQRRVGGYNLDELIEPEGNLAGLLVGSEGTLAAFTGITLKLSPLPAHRVMGVCHFPSFREAMETTRHLVALGPDGGGAGRQQRAGARRRHPAVPAHARRHHQGPTELPAAGRVRRAGPRSLHADLGRLDQCMADHGFPDAVVEVREPARQRRVWDMREACLNIMMSMKGDAQARLVHRGLRRAARAPGRLHRRHHRAVRAPRHDAAPGTRTPRSAACTCGRSST